MIKKYFKTFDLCFNDNDKDNVKYYVKLVYNFGDGTCGYDYVSITKEDFEKFTELEGVWFKEKEEELNNGK